MVLVVMGSLIIPGRCLIFYKSTEAFIFMNFINCCFVIVLLINFFSISIQLSIFSTISLTQVIFQILLLIACFTGRINFITLLFTSCFSPAATTLTGFHFAVTALVGMISNATGFSASKHVPLWELLWFSAVANMSITGMNFSLMLNSVGFYQISKLSMIPVVCVLEWILHNKQYTNQVKMSVVVVVIGVGVCTVTDVKVNGKGFLCACIAVLSTSLQQISIGSLQKKYSIGSFELLSKTAPIQAGSLLVLGPILDYYLSGNLILDYKFTSGAMLFILLSCSLAVFCNVSQYLCIGRFSAVSFQVLGHMKTVCVLTLGWLLFDSELTFKNILGMVVAVVGMVIYSWAVESEKYAHTKITPHAKNSLTEEEIRLLKEGMETAPVKDIELGESR